MLLALDALSSPRPAVTVLPVERDRRPIVVNDDGAVASRVEEEILYREALLRGLDLNDRGIRHRIVEKMRFLSADGDAASDEELYRQAIELGLDRDDVVVRRVLTEKMRRIIMSSVEIAEPTDTDLRVFMERERSRFEQPPRASFSHLFFSRQKRGGHLESDAEAALASLTSMPREPEPAGDPFPHGRSFEARSPDALAKLFGTDFAERVFTLETGDWTGPVTSAYGLHLVRVSDIQRGGLPRLNSVRRQLALGVEHERRKEEYRKVLEQLRGLYPVEIDRSASGGRDAG